MKPYKGWRYKVIVDGQTVAEFGTLAELKTVEQFENAKKAYCMRLKIGMRLIEVEAA